jgi:hypothetical protein
MKPTAISTTAAAVFASLSLAALAAAPHSSAGTDRSTASPPAQTAMAPAPKTTTPAPSTTTPTTRGPATTGQPNQSCEDLGNPPGRATSAPGSAFSPDGTAGTKYAGEQQQNSRNTASVSQYDVACARPAKK